MDLSLLPPHLRLKILNQLSNIEDIINPEGKKAEGKEANSESNGQEGQLPQIFDEAKLMETMENGDDGDGVGGAVSPLLTAADIHHLATKGYLIKDNFLADNTDQIEKITLMGSPSNKPNDRYLTCRTVRQACQEYESDGKLRAAGMKGSETWNASAVRGDRMCWLHGDDTTVPAPLRGVVQAISALQTSLNEFANVPFDASKTQVQLACYPGDGARYVRHRDTFEGGPKRRLTVLYYLNSDWVEEDGGELRLHSKEPLMVQPVGDRMVIFLSEWLEHEVLASHSHRYALTVWFA